MGYSREKMKEYNAKRYADATHREWMKEYNAKRRENTENIEKNRVACVKRNEDIKNHALDSLRVGEIVDQTKWKYFCNGSSISTVIVIFNGLFILTTIIT